MRSEHFQETPLKVRVPRGNDGFWEIICKLHKSQGAFTVADIDGESCVNAQLIRKYIRLLILGGFVEPVSTHRRKRRFVAPLYRLVKQPTRAPRVRPDGSLISGTAIEQLWTAIRNLKAFGLKDLVFAATTPDVKPTYQMAKRYAGYLTTAGYLTVPNASHDGKQVYRLKPGMNTGPLPPCLKAVRADAMFDPNLKAFVGPAPIASEVSR
jgi:hypothetical protein